MVLGNRCVRLYSFPAGDREFLGKPFSRLICGEQIEMKRKGIIIGTVLTAIVFLACYYFYWGSTVPNGQQPLVRLNSSNLSSLKDAFNGSANSVRVVVMLSPT